MTKQVKIGVHLSMPLKFVNASRAMKGNGIKFGWLDVSCQFLLACHLNHESSYIITDHSSLAVNLHIPI